MCRNKAFLKLLKGTLDQDMFCEYLRFCRTSKEWGNKNVKYTYCDFNIYHGWKF